MKTGRVARRSWMSRIGAFLASSVLITGFLESCDDRLLQVATFVDPCGTFLSNCQPGELQARAADFGDYCVDPSCVIPGACETQTNVEVTQPIGTITDICP